MAANQLRSSCQQTELVAYVVISMVGSSRPCILQEHGAPRPGRTVLMATSFRLLAVALLASDMTLICAVVHLYVYCKCRLLPGPSRSSRFKMFVRTVLPCTVTREVCGKGVLPSSMGIPCSYAQCTKSTLRFLLLHPFRAIESVASSPKPCCMRCTGWWKAELPFVGEYSTENVGRTPNAVGLK